MKRVCTSVVALLIITVPLGGCSSFLGLRFGEPVTTPAKERAVYSRSDAKRMSATEEGRRQLEANDVGLAVQSFQKALGNGEAIGPALNGLAVAYARLGRSDLAQRLFQQAIAAEPQNARYGENLNKLLASQAQAARNSRTSSPASERHAIAPLDRPSGALQRVSRGEVKIVTIPSQARPLMGTDTGMERFKPLIRIEFARMAIKSEASSINGNLQQQ